MSRLGSHALIFTSKTTPPSLAPFSEGREGPCCGSLMAYYNHLAHVITSYQNMRLYSPSFCGMDKFNQPILAQAPKTRLQLQVCKCSPLMHSRACPSPPCRLQLRRARADAYKTRSEGPVRKSVRTRMYAPCKFLLALRHKPPDKALGISSVGRDS